MDRFFVGQRVRITGCVQPLMRHHVGKEGRILRACQDNRDCWEVDSALHASNGHPCSWASVHLEPILPDGLRAGDYSNVRDLMDALSSGVPA